MAAGLHHSAHALAAFYLQQTVPHKRQILSQRTHTKQRLDIPTLAAGWKSSPSKNGQHNASANAFPTVLHRITIHELQ